MTLATPSAAQSAATRSPVDADALMARMGELIDQGRLGAARPLLAAARGLAPPSSGLSMLAARLSLGEGALDAAGAELDQALAADPAHPGLRKCRAELRRHLGDTEGATRDAAEAVIHDPADPVAKALLGVLMLDLGRAREAVSCLAEALRAVPRDAAVWEALANALTADDDPDAALAVLREGIDVVPAAAGLRNAAILLCIRRRDFLGAEALAERSRADGVADACTFGLRGHALSSLARHAEAALAYDEALKLGPDDAYVRHLVAAAGIAATAPRAPEDYVRTLFDGYAARFESHLVSLGYRIPGLIRRHVLDFAADRAAAGEDEIAAVLDLGCGTGLMALAVSDLDLGPITGIDLSAGMLELAREKDLYADLRQAELPAALEADPARWPLILAADLLWLLRPPGRDARRRARAPDPRRTLRVLGRGTAARPRRQRARRRHLVPRAAGPLRARRVLCRGCRRGARLPPPGPGRRGPAARGGRAGRRSGRGDGTAPRRCLRGWGRREWGLREWGLKVMPFPPSSLGVTGRPGSAPCRGKSFGQVMG